jgi:hypothetical protein
MIKNIYIVIYMGLYVKYPLLMLDFNVLNFLDRFSTNTQRPNFMKIRPVRAELFHVYGQTEMTKLIVKILRKSQIQLNSNCTCSEFCSNFILRAQVNFGFCNILVFHRSVI